MTVKIGVANEAEINLGIDELKKWTPKNINYFGDTVYFKNLITGVEYPTLRANTGGIFDVVTYGDKMYVQTNGFISTYDKYKRSYNTYFTNSEAVSGIKIDFINENFKTKLLSYSADINGIILIDKFDIQSGELESTFNTGVLINPIYF